MRAIATDAIVYGDDLSALHAALSDRLGVAGVTLCGSGTLALELALRASGIAPGDEVIVPAFCCSAVVQPILALDAIPVLADVGRELNLTTETVAAAITGRTRAVIVPHLFGNPAEIQAIVALANSRKICVVDDAAQALGATLGAQPLATFGDAGVISFGQEKICFGIGGGVMITRQTRPGAELRRWRRSTRAATLGSLAHVQFNWCWRRWTRPVVKIFQMVGSRAATAGPLYPREAMANMQASIALSLIQTLDETLAARRARARLYRDLLGNQDGLELISHGAGSACLTQVIRVVPRRRGRDLAAAVIDSLGACGYEVQGSYLPVHLHDHFRGCVWDRLPYTERVWPDLIELPCGPAVRLDDIERIAAIVKRTISS